ncbi:MAG: xanthine dehydrogenase molybdopterin binding subunit [Sulfitobacter litoralis]|jgi:xanthine dehydrogenase large subunit|uniref:Aldehyde oxidoreductase molybdenum-binding subunit PaoC n=2 Tax=root TaxID=1 RepID=A0A1H0UTL6_9RHOB|nr:MULTISPECIES: xanthine dehydrogenase molybdopterin binding subunit [Sulfitobacter]MBQ0717932.1 xanthine dehydrogenase molybdopterin binding subunit [Sulfitobacter litoralis]MBQ0764919.1 xanthine dehydrogenase molybdopterin binding subunit [Sulfitobacter litoralis]MBQ0800813.1 xanthine dehydrogenase molybdopterin binding subunit [Sulfitobacter litoralis]MCF7726692.1 xanthine dehydrogenase molybdopterin binding subunit [Sulfitobacter sp. M22]MCF7778015.1 xanthine dehydrogenase molybdopterin b|tara:strand:- start:5038 stop:7443 length:2406 start_codon:yes stop_codon:yes gene_type:complete
MSVAKSLPHDAAKLHVTGAARYVDDIPTPATTLHIAFGLSTVAAGTLNGMDLRDVAAAPGVVAVLTAADLPFDNDVSPSNHDEPLLATNAVHYAGQPVFMVVATTHLAARHAARLGAVDITPTASILSIEKALAAESRFEDGPRIYQKGDAAAALTTAPQSLSGTINIGGQEHFYLEGQAALALPQDNGDMVVHSSTQHPTEIQHKVAEALGTPMHAVRVETRRMGGGFGGKESQGNALAVACAVAAARTGRPCKMRYDRDDDMIVTGKRHDFRIDYTVGFDADGRIKALDFTHYTRCGWAMDLSLPVADRAMLHADNAYHLDNIRITSHRLRTNTQSATAFRGFGGPQGIVGIERVMDHIAQSLCLDPLAVRRANFYADVMQPDATGKVHDDRAVPDDTEADLASRGAPPAPQGGTPPQPTDMQTTPYHQPVQDCIINALTDRLAQTSDYAARRAAIADWNATQPILKRGIALTPVKFGISFTLTHLNQAGALVHVYQDGSIHLNHGGTEMGQGLFQKVAQVAANRFGVDLSAVKITATDTGKVPNTSATAASSGTDLNGMAVQAACDTVRDRIADHLAERYQTTADQIRFADGQVHIGEEVISFAQAAASAYENRVSLSSTGFYKTPEIEWDRIKGRGRPFFYFAYGAAVTEVVIDTLTGENRILRADILHDAGASLNPALDIGQIEGGYVQGAGWLTTEELVWDAKGTLKTHAPSTYKIPAISDRPDVFNVALWDAPNPAQTVYRSKAVGEPPLMLGISAFMALSDAVSACGDGFGDLQTPATAEAVLTAIGKARNAL